jgi:hypothetical protein
MTAVNTYDIVFSWHFEDDRVGPDAMLVKAPGHRQAGASVDAFVLECYSTMLNIMSRRPAWNT